MWQALSIGNMQWPWPSTYLEVKFVARWGTTILRICLLYFHPWPVGAYIFCIIIMKVVWNGIFEPTDLANVFCCHLWSYWSHFYDPGQKGPPGASSNQIVCLSVSLSAVWLSVILPTYKVQSLKFGWRYSSQTWTVGSSISKISHTSPTSHAPGGGAGSKCRTFKRFLPYFDFVAARGIHVSQTRLVFTSFDVLHKSCNFYD